MPIRAPRFLEYGIPETEPESNASAFQAAASAVLTDWAPSEAEEGSSFTPSETYPEQRPDGSVWEVTHNRATGVYTDRLVTPAPWQPLPSPATWYPSGPDTAPSEAEEGSSFTGMPMPINYPQAPGLQQMQGAPEIPQGFSEFERSMFERMVPNQETTMGALRAVGGTVLPGYENMLRAGLGEQQVQGEGAWRALDIAGTVADFVPLFGVAGRGLVRGAKALDSVASFIPPSRTVGLLTDEAASLQMPKWAIPDEHFYHVTTAQFDPTDIKPMNGNPIFISRNEGAAAEFVKVNHAKDINSGQQLHTIRYKLSPEAKVLDQTHLSDVALTKWMLDITKNGTIPMQDAVLATGFDVIHATGKRSMVANPAALIPATADTLWQRAAHLVGDESGFAKLPGWQESRRRTQELFLDNMSGVRNLAKGLDNATLQKFNYANNRLGSTATIASERTMRVYEGVAKQAQAAGIQPTEFSGFTDDVEQFLTAKTATAWKKAHPTAHGRPFGNHATPAAAAQWEATFAANPDTTYRDAVEGAARVVADNHARNREMLVRTGRMTQTEANALKRDYPWYNPLSYSNVARPAESPNMSIGASRGADLLAKDVPAHASINKPLDAVMLANNSAENFYSENQFMHQALDVMRRDPQMAQHMRRLKSGETINSDIERGIHVWNKGKKEEWAVPKWAAEEIGRELRDDSGSRVFSFVNTINMAWRKGAIDFNPSFIVRNLFNDMINSYATTGNIPTKSAGEMVRYLKNNPDDQVLSLFRQAGAEQSKFWQTASQSDKVKYAQMMMSEQQKAAGLTTPEAIAKHLALVIPRMVGAVGGSIPKVGRATEQGNRLAVFQKELTRLMPDWKQKSIDDLLQTPEVEQAVNASLDSVINYSRGGYLMKEINKIIPFANVAMQGALLPLRAMTTTAGRWRVAKLMGAYTGLTVYNNTYPENNDVPPFIRYGTAYMMLPTEDYTIEGKPKPNYIVFGPLRDWIPVTGGISLVVEKFGADSPTAGHQFGATVMENLPSGVGPGPILDNAAILALKFDLFRNKPIVPPSEQSLSPHLQFGGTTSPTARGLAGAWGEVPILSDLPVLSNLQSPRVMQRAVESTTTGPGRIAVSVSDWILQTYFADQVDEETTKVVESIRGLPPEERELALTGLPSEFRDHVEQKATFTRTPSIPVVGPLIKTVKPGIGGALEDVMPRSEDARKLEMEAVLGDDAVIMLRDLSGSVPMMNDYFSHEGRKTKLTSDQLALAHDFYKDRLQIELLPILESREFAEIKSENWSMAQTIVRNLTRKVEDKIKGLVLTNEQRAALRMPLR